MRLRSLLPAAVLLVAACSDQNGLTEASSSSATRQIVAPSGSLDSKIYELFQLFPKGQETAGLNRWTTAKRAYEKGQTDQARKQLVELARWVQSMAGKMSQPPAGESRSAAASRLVLYMSLYIYSGPATPIPAYTTGADNAVGIVTPGAAATIVTPSKNAGVSLPAGAVNEETVVVITENPTPYPANCSGPLQTKYCQYPRFYHFSQFPHVKLNVAAKFAVCHINHGSVRAPLPGEDHDEFRLAHTAPTNPADYTPGSTVHVTGGQNVEILPLITQTFSICDDVEYALAEPTGLRGAFAYAMHQVKQLVTPKSAFAIDQGGGGKAVMFSDFNNVDTLGVPDNAITGVTVISPIVDDTLRVTYTINNVGTATSPTVLAHIAIQQTAVTFVPPVIDLTDAGVMPLAPDAPFTLTTKVPLPPGTSFGSYNVMVTLNSNPSFPDAVLTNNGGSAAFSYPGPVLGRVTPKKTIGR